MYLVPAMECTYYGYFRDIGSKVGGFGKCNVIKRNL